MFRSFTGVVAGLAALALCAAPAPAQTTVRFVASLLGTYELQDDGSYEFCLEGDGDPVGEFVGSGEYTVGSDGEVIGSGTFNAADGDIYFTFSGFLRKGGSFAGSLQIVGGTDLYENASGGAQLFGPVDDSDDEFMLDIKGVITYGF